MKRTRITMEIHLVAGPAASVIASDVYYDEIYIDHMLGDSGDLDDKILEKERSLFVTGFLARKTPNFHWPVSIAPSQIAFVISRLADGETIF